MRSLLKATAVTLMAAALLAASLASASAPERSGLTIVGLVHGTKLVELRSDNTRIRTTTTVTGLGGDASLVGIDHRVQDGKLYGVGNRGGIYAIDAKARASKVGALTVPLDGTNFGVDSNPAANALRVVSDNGQNLRQSFAATPLAATVADTALTDPAVAPATGTVPATGVTAAALQVGGRYALYEVDLLTGATSRVGSLSGAVSDIAIRLQPR